jgi:hypothetical protein
MMNSTATSTIRHTAFSEFRVFTNADKVAGFIIQRGRIGFEAFTANEKAADLFETLHHPATALRELAAAAYPDGD